MKKMYIKPETKEFQIVAQQTLMAGSMTVTVSSDNYNESDMTDLSRSGRFYDDEEE